MAKAPYLNWIAERLQIANHRADEIRDDMFNQLVELEHPEEEIDVEHICDMLVDGHEDYASNSQTLTEY